jgi:hypothetical protein
MVVLRCTRRVAERFALSPVDDAPPSSSVLGDWYVNTLNVGRVRLLLAVAERSFLPVLLPARRGEFPGRFAEHVRVVLPPD